MHAKVNQDGSITITFPEDSEPADCEWVEQLGDKRWVLSSKGGDRLSYVQAKGFDITIFGVLFVVPGFFKRGPNTRWRFGSVAKGILSGKGHPEEGTWLGLSAL
ncbi:hypothetical protein HYH02_010355 [Chlamydomonas schloesseri]|uniref:Uncharacterized protein n=1 Tax=Chlamydomonas schloesseri TaxID=2026947 RepID=A0A835TKF2_9CHLO|nr:hypothetical protein HYH02_010355 [Chlamydomonas schloesseri]|eukprot:KAG2440475.1 hypothetical protein HYH02_010355 [Chlamydomonas schloesseri]